jgi:hypothetical protein|tara:strand:- start:265 stop:474 length:210 start_codon:yes stop_codon:yes gene_type:complete
MKDFIKKHYGSNVKLADDLGISNQTVTNWIKSNPRGMLKYLPEIVSKVDTTERQIVWEVMLHEKEISRD